MIAFEYAMCASGMATALFWEGFHDSTSKGAVSKEVFNLQSTASLARLRLSLKIHFRNFCAVLKR